MFRLKSIYLRRRKSVLASAEEEADGAKAEAQAAREGRKMRPGVRRGAHEKTLDF